jgi:hypothetical protein
MTLSKTLRADFKKLRRKRKVKFWGQSSYADPKTQTLLTSKLTVISIKSIAEY